MGRDGWSTVRSGSRRLALIAEGNRRLFLNTQSRRGVHRQPGSRAALPLAGMGVLAYGGPRQWE